jgi:MFS family permease
MSGGLIGVVVPLYLAECLPAQNRGKGTGIFQWLLTLGIGAAALVGTYVSYHVEEVALLGGPAALFVFKKHSWRMSRPPGILITLGACFVSESPRWLYTRVAIDWKEAADGSHNTSFNAQAASDWLARSGPPRRNTPRKRLLSGHLYLQRLHRHHRHASF